MCLKNDDGNSYLWHSKSVTWIVWISLQWATQKTSPMNSTLNCLCISSNKSLCDSFSMRKLVLEGWHPSICPDYPSSIPTSSVHMKAPHLELLAKPTNVTCIHAFSDYTLVQCFCFWVILRKSHMKNIFAFSVKLVLGNCFIVQSSL